ncbi:MAG TPA: PEP-CTERM sorting domain-containing protein [Phycisphaerae bacterium]|nr:PEP-CTERM sorting domain-containing protein [Phycisphaerales bacterium]HRX87501.1 PEP-CTERM sorting domain-containing protein [Phycisphaerae bacterium]
MTLRTKIGVIGAGLALIASAPALATIQVALLPASQTVNIADGTTTVDIVAVIPQADAIVSWGLDLGLSGTSVSYAGATVGPAWTPTTGADGDAFAGLAPTPPGSAIWSDPTAILLATVTLSLDSLGVTDLVLSDDNPADLTEGFALNPPPVGAFADVVYTGGTVNVVIPEPASLALLALGGLAVAAPRRRR